MVKKTREEKLKECKTPAEKRAACYRAGISEYSESQLKKAISKTRNSEDYSVILTIFREMDSDWESEDLKLLEFYELCNEGERSIIDYFLVTLCGWTMKTIIEKTA